MSIGISQGSYVERKRIPIFITILILSVSCLLAFNMLQKNYGQSEPKNIDYKNGTISALSSSPDGKITYLGMVEKHIIAVDSESSILWKLDTGAKVLDIAVNMKYIIAGCDDRKVYIISPEGTLLKTFPVLYRPTSISVNPEGNRIAVSSTLSPVKSSIQIFDINGGELLKKLTDSAAKEIFILRDNNVAYVTSNSEIILIDQNGDQIKKVNLKYYAADAVYSKDMKILSVLDQDNSVYTFNEELDELWDMKLSQKAISIEIDSINKNVIIGGKNGFLGLYDENGKHRLTLNQIGDIKKMDIDDVNGFLLILNDTGKLLKFEDSFTELFLIRSILRFITVGMIILSLLLIAAFINLSQKVRRLVIEKLRMFLSSIMHHKKSYILMIPAVTLVMVFCYYPAISGFLIAFTDYKPGIYMRWVGLENFVTMVKNTYFWVGIGNMLIFLGTDLIKALIFPIFFAELIFTIKSKSAQYWTRVALYIPGILPGVAGLMIWTSGILGPNGAINEFLRMMGLGRFATAWLGNERTAVWALVFIGFPWIGAYIIFYGSLLGIPGSLFEAAKIDGCTWIKRVIKIDIPLILPQIKYVFITSFIVSIQDFGRVYLTTMGGPGHSTYVPILELYYNMSKFQNYGVAAAMGLFLFVVIFSATLFNLRMKTNVEE